MALMKRFCDIWGRKLNDNPLPPRGGVLNIPKTKGRICAPGMAVLENRRYHKSRKSGGFEEELKVAAIDNWSFKKNGVWKLSWKNNMSVQMHIQTFGRIPLGPI